jgi:hypothetical protein
MYPKLYIDFTLQSQLPPSLKCNRSSIGYAINQSGRLVQFAANTPRIGADGIVIEPQSTNLFTHSKDLTTWTKTGIGTIVMTTSIDGTLANIGLTSLSLGSTVTLEKVIMLTGTHVLSFYADLPTNNFYTVTFGSTTTQIKQGYNEVVGVNPSSVKVEIIPLPAPSVLETVKIDAVQVEARNSATSHIVTTGSTVTRNADEVYIEINQSSPSNWFNPNNGTFLVDCKTNGLKQEQTLLNLVNQSNPTIRYMRAGIERDPDTVLKVGYDNNKTFNFFSACDNPGNIFRFGTSYIDEEQLVSLVGRTQTNSATLATSLNFVAINRLYLGRYHNGKNLFSGKLLRLGYYDITCDQQMLNQLTYR